MSLERRINKESLKLLKGSFTSSTEVGSYIKSKIPHKQKLSRLYTKVHFARDTSLSIPKTSDIFRLMKEQRKLSLKTCATNLKLYLDNVITKTQVSLRDLREAIAFLKEQS